MKKEDAYKLGVGQTQFRKKFKRKKRIRKARQFIAWSLLLLILSAALFSACIHVSQCQDTGMNNTISQGDYVFANRLAFALRQPERGEIVTCILKDSAGIEKIYQRRIIAYPGEIIEITNDGISVNGQLCVEDYIKAAVASENSIITVPPGCYYVLCDDRNAGPDSRDGIYITPSSIKGAVILNSPLLSPTELIYSVCNKLYEKGNENGSE